MNEAGFYEAVIPEPYTILGLRLKPLCLGHLILLGRIGSPFITREEEEITLGDLAVAVLICSRNYAQGVILLDREDLADAVYQWAQKLTSQNTILGRLGLKYRKIDAEEKLKLFTEYVAESVKGPDYSYEASKAKQIDLPTVQVVKVVLMSKTTLTENEILNRPWRLCLWDFLTLRALEGQVDIVDNSAIEEAREKANRLAEMLNKKRNGKA